MSCCLAKYRRRGRAGGHGQQTCFVVSVGIVPSCRMENRGEEERTESGSDCCGTATWGSAGNAVLEGWVCGARGPEGLRQLQAPYRGLSPPVAPAIAACSRRRHAALPACAMLPPQTSTLAVRTPGWRAARCAVGLSSSHIGLNLELALLGLGHQDAALVVALCLPADMQEEGAGEETHRRRRAATPTGAPQRPATVCECHRGCSTEWCRQAAQEALLICIGGGG